MSSPSIDLPLTSTRGRSPLPNTGDRTRVRVRRAAVLLFALGGCFLDGTGPSLTVATVQVAAGTDTLTALGSTTQFTATALNAEGDTLPARAVVWTSADESIATVNDSGVVTAVGPGSAGIEAAVEGITGTTPVAVVQVVTAVEVAVPRDTLTAIGDTTRATATPRDANGNQVPGQTVSWTVDDEDVATVDTSGLITATGPGLVTATATVSALSANAQLTVHQVPASLVFTTAPSGAAAGQPFGTQPVLEIRDALDRRVSRDSATSVTATIDSGGGTLLGSATATALGGVITFTDLGVGGTVGERRLAFAANDLDPLVSAPFTVVAGTPAQLTKGNGDGQAGLAGAMLSAAFEVTVTDAYDNAVEGADVTWNVTQGEGTFSENPTLTDADGFASVVYELGAHAGTEIIAASVDGGATQSFTVTATPNGTIAGVISLSSATLAPPATSSSAPSARTRLTTAAPRALRQGDALDFAPGELIVTFRSDATVNAAPANATRAASAMRAALAVPAQQLGFDVAGTSPGILASRVRVHDAASLDAVMTALRANPNVAAVEQNAIAYSHALRGSGYDPPGTTTPTDPLYPWQAWHYAMIGLPEAWAITTGDANVLVAVVDDGIRFDHPDIAANLTNDGYDFVSNNFSIPNCTGGGSVGSAGDGDGYDNDPTNPFYPVINQSLGCIIGPSASGNHGLHVSGTIGASAGNGAGGSGVNWNVSIRPVRALGLAGGTYYDIAQAVLYAAGLPADNGSGGTVQAASAARIINMSLGGSSASSVLEAAINSATSAGALIIASAGNSGSSNPNYPAAYPAVVSVSALGPDATLAYYSTYGTTVDITAPGGDLSDGGCAFGVISSTWNYQTSTPTYDCWQGTSMAAPHVSGVAALVLAAEPTLTGSQLRARLETYAVDIGATGLDNLYGNGVVNVRNAITQSLSAPADRYARLVDATTLQTLATTATQPDGNFAFTELPDGDFFVYGGEDREDGVIGIPFRRWGAFGGPAAPSAITVDGAGDYPASFSIGVPSEAEPNNTLNDANQLPIGGYLFGTISPSIDGDYSRVQILTSGTYTFETWGPHGACGFALQEDTILDLYDATGSLIASHDDIDAAALDFCSRITMSLSAGTYYVRVSGYIGGQYTIAARAGS